MLAEGKTVRSVADNLGLSIKTVDAHKFNLMRKLGIHNKAELVMRAIQEARSETAGKLLRTSALLLQPPVKSNSRQARNRQIGSGLGSLHRSNAGSFRWPVDPHRGQSERLRRNHVVIDTLPDMQDAVRRSVNTAKCKLEYFQ